MSIWFIACISCLLFLPVGSTAANATDLPGVSGLDVRAANGLQFSPDGKWLFAVMGSMAADRIVIWDASTQEKVAELKSPDGVISSFAVSPTGAQVATGHGDSIYIWDFDGGWARVTQTELIGEETARLVQKHPNLRKKVRRVHAISFSRNGQTLAWAWEDHQIHLWDLAARKELTSLPVDLPFTSYGGNLHFVSDQQLLAVGIKSGNGYELQLWDVNSATRRPLKIPRGRMSVQATVRPDGQTLAALVSGGHGKSSKPTELWIWDLRSGKAKRVGPGPLPEMFCPQFSPDGDTIAIGLYANHRLAGGRIAFLDAATHRQKGVLPMTRRGTCPAHLAFSPNGDYLASAVYFDQAPVQLWRLKTATSESPYGP